MSTENGNGSACRSGMAVALFFGLLAIGMGIGFAGWSIGGGSAVARVNDDARAVVVTPQGGIYYVYRASTPGGSSTVQARRVDKQETRSRP